MRHTARILGVLALLSVAACNLSDSVEAPSFSARQGAPCEVEGDASGALVCQDGVWRLQDPEWPADAPLDLSEGADARPDLSDAPEDQGCEQSDATLCETYSLQCGALGVIDACGKPRRVQCGDCPGDAPCDAYNQCTCVAEDDIAFCARVGAQCGEVTATDNCGDARTTSCGGCASGRLCDLTTNTCACVPESAAAFCGRQSAQCGSVTANDNCGAVRTERCGECASGDCRADNTCELCQPESDLQLCARLNRQCGTSSATDNCGNARSVDCTLATGGCGQDESCATNQCVCPAASCGARTCGTVANACGSSASCGACASDETCTNGQCVCVPEGNTTFCARLGKACGALTGLDNCGVSREASCGGCLQGLSCVNNDCTCVPESRDAFCGRYGAQCGSLTRADNCGNMRTESCGGCAGGGTCEANNTCAVCNAESDVAFCTRLGKRCGEHTGADNCGASRTVNCTTARGPCPSGEVCNSLTNQCNCPSPRCLINACGTITNACGASANCGFCSSGPCVNNLCQTQCQPCTRPPCPIEPILCPEPL